MNSKRIVIAGGSGFIGQALTREFARRGFAVTVLTRSPRPRADRVVELTWDGTRPGPWTAQLDGAHAVINLTGKNINCPHTPRNLKEIAASRVKSVNALAAAIHKTKTPPRVWVQVSAVGYYGDTGSRAGDENAPAGTGDLAEVCRRWEAAFDAAQIPATRKVLLRLGFVLGRHGGALPLLSKMTRLFLGGAAGGGRQYVSWIHLADAVAIFVAAVENEKLSQIYNAVGPQPVTNGKLMRELRRTLHRPWSPPAPAVAVKVGARIMGTEGSLALANQRCFPEKLLEAGFKFQFWDVRAALADLCQPEDTRRPA